MDAAGIKNRILNYLFPDYDELTLFLYSIISILFIIFNMGNLINSLVESIPVSSKGDLIKSFIFFIVVLYIIFLPIYHAFSKRKKRRWEKGLMLIIIVIMNFIIAWNVYDYLKVKSTGWDLLFPLINAIQASLVLAGMRFNAVTADKISDDNVSAAELAISGVLMMIVFIIYHHVLHEYWAITFSVCVFYATMINRLMILFFKAVKNRRMAS